MTELRTQDAVRQLAEDVVRQLNLPATEHRVGVDLVRVGDVADALRAFGDRYLRRIFTEHERGCCAGRFHVAAAGLAARFAAKEATIKLLRPTAVQPPWTDIEVVQQPGGACDLKLHGAAARLATAAGLHSQAVSLSHDGDFAVAVTIALVTPCKRPEIGASEQRGHG